MVTAHAGKAMAPHSSSLAWKIPRTEKPGRLQSMGLLRVRRDWATSLSLFTFMHWRRKWQPAPVFLPGESQGQRSLVGCRLWGRTESDTTEVTSCLENPRDRGAWWAAVYGVTQSWTWLKRLSSSKLINGEKESLDIGQPQSTECMCAHTPVLCHIQLFVTPWIVACQAPLSWDFPGKNTGVGCHFLLQGIFPTQRWNLCLSCSLSLTVGEIQSWVNTHNCEMDMHWSTSKPTADKWQVLQWNSTWLACNWFAGAWLCWSFQKHTPYSKLFPLGFPSHQQQHHSPPSSPNKDTLYRLQLW